MAADLGEFEGRKITKITSALRKAGDGLSKSMEIDPVDWHQGDKVYVLYECEVGTISFPPLSEEGEVAKRYDLVAQVARVVDSKDAAKQMDAQRQRIIAAEEERKGIDQMFKGDAEVAHLHGDHLLGYHEEPVPGCPDCPPSKAKKKATKRPAKKRALKAVK